MGPRRTEAWGLLWVFPVSSPVSRIESLRPQASLQIVGGGDWGRNTSRQPGFQNNMLLHQLIRTENSIPTPTRPGSPWAGEFLSISQPPPSSRNSMEAASFLLLRKKHFVLSFLSSARLGISVSSDCTVLEPWLETCLESSQGTGSGCRPRGPPHRGLVFASL